MTTIFSKNLYQTSILNLNKKEKNERETVNDVNLVQ